jgi:hypothetical protein
MVNHLESKTYSGSEAKENPPADGFKVGIVAAASLLAGGLIGA